MRLKQIREEMQLTQEDLARLAGIGLMTIKRAERGRAISYPVALALLQAINYARQLRQLPALSLDDLQLLIS